MLIRNLPDLPKALSSVLITGATGFIGQCLVRSLLDQGHSVRAVIRPNKQTDNRLPHHCEQVPVELTDVEKLAALVADSSAVIYCAGSVRGRRPEDFSTANILGIKVIREALERLSNPPPLLLISSLAASRPHLSDYARSKYEGEQLLPGNGSLPWTIIRPPAVYGPGDKEMLPIFKLARRGFIVHAGPHNQRLSLLHVSDLANAVNAWLAAWQQCLHKTYSIDDGKNGGYSWAEIGELVSVGKYSLLRLPQILLSNLAKINLLFSMLLRYQPMLTPGKVRELIQPDWLGDNRQFTTATGWEPVMGLHQGVMQLFAAKPVNDQREN